MKCVHHRVRPGRARYEHPASDVRIAATNLPHNIQRRIVRFVRRKQNFVIGIVLPEEALNVLLKPHFQPVHRLEHRNRRQERIVRN